MAGTPDERRKKDLAQVHLARKALGLDDETYRAFLRTRFKVESSAKLNADGLRRLLEAFREMGWAPTKKPGEKASPKVRKVWALWHALGRAGKLDEHSNKALRAFCQRQTGVDDPAFCDSRQLDAVIEALKAWQARPVQRQEQPDALP
jgi:phage gp16-like protein